MKKMIFSPFLVMLVALTILTSCQSKTESDSSEKTDDVTASASNEKKHLFFDVHDLEPGKIDLKAVAGAHQKDLETQGKYGVDILKYWVDEAKGKVYCLAQADDSASLYSTHKEAHGLVPSSIREITGDIAASVKKDAQIFLDLHRFGPGKVDAKAVAGAHEKDLAIQDKYNMKFVNYWLDEKSGTVMCLVEAPDSATVCNAHKEAHGLVPEAVRNVKQGI